MANTVKQKLRAGECVFGQMIMEFYTQGVAQMLANGGAEFVIYDMEHGRCDISMAAAMFASCKGTGVEPFVRVPDLATYPLSRVLDLGARGVMIPRVETGAQMREIVAQLKYAPQGRRGVALGIAHDNFKLGGPEFFASANEDTVVIALIETAKALENLDDIISTPGLDVAWMGHYDLTVSMGIPAQFTNPRFLDAMDDLVEASRRHGVAPGFLVTNPQDALRWIAKGFRALSLGADVYMYSQAFRGFHDAVLAGLPSEAAATN
jgi:2-dehydro-3-deoxyglucarate aldolase/4-hydroxy-2-oxoheptanedioate aldolase